MGRIGSRLAGYGNIIASAQLSTSYALTNAYADVSPAWQIVVPANSGTIELAIPSALLTVVTGTNAVGTTFPVDVKILDEANTQMAYAQFRGANSLATTQTLSGTISLHKLVANNTAAKTYRVQARCTLVGTSSCTSALHTSSTGFTDPALLARRA